MILVRIFQKPLTTSLLELVLIQLIFTGGQSIPIPKMSLMSVEYFSLQIVTTRLYLAPSSQDLRSEQKKKQALQRI